MLIAYIIYTRNRQKANRGNDKLLQQSITSNTILQSNNTIAAIIVTTAISLE